MFNSERLVEQTETHYEPKKINGEFRWAKIVSLDQFAVEDVETVVRVAREMKRRVREDDIVLRSLCQGKTQAEMFYEASTRTDMSFQNAIEKMGGGFTGPINGIQFSSKYKGENLFDTMCAVGCYSDLVVLRHPEEGATYKAAYALEFLEWKTGKRTGLLSGGDGIGEHPTQALLDIFTLEEFMADREEVTVTLVGDLKNGRTVHSLAKLLSKHDGKKYKVNLVSPESLRMPSAIIQELADAGIKVHETDNINSVIGNSDVIYWTRIQEERFENLEDYEAVKDSFIMSPDLLSQAKADAILMHPLPRKHEMGTEKVHEILDKDPRTVYFHQMENGLYIRMALIGLLTGRVPIEWYRQD